MKKILLGVAVISLIIVGFVIFKSDDPGSPSVNNVQNLNPVAPPSTNDKPSTGSYIEYSSEAVAKTTGTKLLFFHAPWCPQCRALETDIKQKGVPQGVTIIKTDYDSNQSLRRKYGVTIQTTFVKINDQGQLIKKYVAYDEPTLDSVKQNLL